MKVKILLAAILLNCFYGGRAQNTIQLNKQDTVLHTTITSEQNTTTSHIILSITLTHTGKTITDLDIPVLLLQGRTNSDLNLTLKTDKVKISKTEWPASGSSKVINKTVDIQTNSVKSLAADAVAYLSFDQSGADSDHIFTKCENCNVAITVTKNAAYDSTKTFWMEVGANFDLIDGLQPNNFFTGVFFYKKDIRNFYKNGKAASDKNLGVFAGVYESKSITTSNVADSNYSQYNDKSAFRLARHDSLPVFRDSGNLSNTTVVRNVSLFFSPQLRLTNGLSGENGFHVFLSLWLELQWQRVTRQFDYSQLKRIDTIFVPSATVNNYPSKTTKMESDYRSHYFGIGLPIFFKENNTNLYFSPTFGATNQPSYLIDPKTAIATFSQSWHPFFIFQFRLNEEKYGFAFTGEVRGLIKKDNAPIVSLALTKKFDITKFLEFK